MLRPWGRRIPGLDADRGGWAQAWSTGKIGGGEEDVRGSMEQDEEWVIEVMSKVMAFSPGDGGPVEGLGDS